MLSGSALPGSLSRVIWRDGAGRLVILGEQDEWNPYNSRGDAAGVCARLMASLTKITIIINENLTRCHFLSLMHRSRKRAAPMQSPKILISIRNHHFLYFPPEPFSPGKLGFYEYRNLVIALTLCFIVFMNNKVCLPLTTPNDSGPFSIPVSIGEHSAPKCSPTPKLVCTQQCPGP